MSYLLNAAFWDSCFFSTIPTGATSSGLPDNSRFKFNAGPIPSKAQLGVTGNTATVSDALNSSQFLPKEYAPARYLMLDGAFNINSTSVEAWKALLAGLRRRAAGNTDSELSTKPSAFPRSLNQPFDAPGADNVGSLTSPSTFGSHGGFRRLTDAQITALATNIVLEIPRPRTIPVAGTFHQPHRPHRHGELHALALDARRHQRPAHARRRAPDRHRADGPQRRLSRPAPQHPEHQQQRHGHLHRFCPRRLGQGVQE